ncbi:hypothetical protein FG05_35027 [Fusarium graminearum]|nr:hypothetical protein FG05_35027 [Fusarium graminearum]
MYADYADEKISLAIDQCFSASEQQ